MKKLAEDSAVQESFKKSPAAVLKQHGIDHENIPQEVEQLFAGAGFNLALNKLGALAGDLSADLGVVIGAAEKECDQIKDFIEGAPGELEN